MPKKHQIEDLYIKSKLICKEQGPKTKEYQSFIEKIAEVKTMTALLNQMRRKGYRPDKEFVESVGLSDMRGETGEMLRDKLKTMRATLGNWERSLGDLFRSIDLANFENYYLSYFLGINLVKLRSANLRHFLKYIDSKIEIGNLGGFEGGSRRNGRTEGFDRAEPKRLRQNYEITEEVL